MKRLLLAFCCVALLIHGCGQGLPAPTGEPEGVVTPIATVEAPTTPVLIAPEYQSMRSVSMNLINVAAATEEAESPTLWQMPEGAWIHQITKLDAETISLSYSPLPEDGESGFAAAGIYKLALGAADPEPILLPDEPDVSYFNPIWTADGRYMFYVRYAGAIEQPNVALMRYDAADGSTQLIAQDGIWPRLSVDNEHLTFIIVDPITQDRGIVVTNLEGGNRVQLVRTGMYYDVDTPVFSQDGDYVYFTASLAGRKVGWLDWLLGVRTVSAHADANVPVEWMRVSVDGGEHEQLSAENRVIMYGDFSADGQTLYFSALDGFYAMPTSGGAYTQLSSIPSIRTFIHEAMRLPD